MRNKQEICDYLYIDNNTLSGLDNSVIINAVFIEKKYEKELSTGQYGYALESDFYSFPHILEDEEMFSELKEIENIHGLIVYEIIEAEDL